jgi:23S rRNA pseudouridine2457 synthase
MGELRCLAFYKPFEVLCQFTDSQGRRTLKDFIPIAGIYPAGRLDYRSEGLLLLSDDGDLLHRLTDPDFEHPKTYLVQLEGVIDEQAVHRLNREIVLPGLQTKLIQAEAISQPDVPPRPVRAYHPSSWLRIVLKEGKKHQVRRMTAAVGYPTLRLIRVAIGPITLGGLKPGDYRWLGKDEIARLKSIRIRP